MAGACCASEAASRRLARRLSEGAAATLPAALLVLLPKCPVCLAAWLTLTTGVTVTAGGAAWLREGFVLLPLGVALVVILRRVYFFAVTRWMDNSNATRPSGAA